MTTTLLRPVPFQLSDDARTVAVESLNTWLVDLIALGLRLKQAHWNLRGARFKNVHEQFDEILADVRVAVDDVAERAVTIGGAADGRPETVAKRTTLGEFPAGRLTVEQAIDLGCGDLAAAIQCGRAHLGKLAEADPISEDLAIGILSTLEKHHWLLHSQRADA